MTKKYNRDKKERLVSKINKLSKKEDFIQVYNLIQEKEQKPIKEIGESTMMFFHDLKYETYEAVDKLLRSICKREKKHDQEQATTENTEYRPYSQDEFPSQKEMSPKLKYSNRERNLLKRKRYDQTLMEENGSDVVYCKFNIENLTETDVNTTDQENALNENVSSPKYVKENINSSENVPNYLEENESNGDTDSSEKKSVKKNKKEKKSKKSKKSKKLKPKKAIET